MHAPETQAGDPRRQRAHDRRRLQRALTASLLAVFVLCVGFLLQFGLQQNGFDWTGWTVTARDWHGLPGILTAPLLHGSPEHLGGNAVALLLLGTLAGTAYPRATLRALPLLWLGSGLGAWLLGTPGSHHLGASGVAHGLLFLVFVLGLLRRDRAAIAAAMIAFLFYGGMLLTVLPREVGVSWQSHLGGAAAGVLAAWLWRRADPMPPRKRYSWELEEHAMEERAIQERAMEEQAERGRDAANDAAMFELPSPDEVPVIWHRPSQLKGTVLPFASSRRKPDGD